MSYESLEIGSATAEAIRVNPYSVGFCNECWADKTVQGRFARFKLPSLQSPGLGIRNKN